MFYLRSSKTAIYSLNSAAFDLIFTWTNRQTLPVWTLTSLKMMDLWHVRYSILLHTAPDTPHHIMPDHNNPNTFHPAPSGKYYTAEQRVNCASSSDSSSTSSSVVKVGVFYNDVWAYRLENPTLLVGLALFGANMCHFLYQSYARFFYIAVSPIFITVKILLYWPSKSTILYSSLKLNYISQNMQFDRTTKASLWWPSLPRRGMGRLVSEWID